MAVTPVDYERALNPEQLRAVRSTEGPFLVIAGAGSGKTRVLVYRVAYLVQQGVQPGEVLLLTFTRKAASEMLRRATQLLDERCNRVAGGTFHSFANATLRQYASLAGLSPHFSILDESDSQDALNLSRTQLGLHKLPKRFPRKSTIRDIFSKSVNKSCSLRAVLEAEYPHFIEWEEALERLQKAYGEYKRSKELLDYDDLLVRLRDLLRDNEKLRLALSRRYRYIMVDEYQDTNRLQAHLVCLLASAHKNVMVVGDDSQSIYSFRGANVRNIMDFPQLFPGTQVITLEQNYRSSQPILSLTNEIIRFAGEKYEKRLFTEKSGGLRPVFVDAADEHAQSRFVAEKILQLREEGIELKECAVLFRSGWHSNDLEIELANRSIPFVKYGGQRFVEAAHIKDMVAYLRILYNLRDAVSWHRALLLMPGIGPKTAERLLLQIVTEGKGLDCSLDLGPKTEAVQALLDLLKQLSGKELPVEHLLEPLIDYYVPLLREKYDDFNKRTSDLESLQRIAERYRSLEEFLADLALEPPERSIIEAGRQSRDDECLTLSTIHSAKGLEWHTVFIIYAAEGHLPSYLSLEDPQALEEERRLMYVATTRAKENLFLVKPHLERSPRGYMDQGASVFTQISRFLAEGDILERCLDVESSATEELLETIDLDDISPGKAWPQDKEFLDSIEDYFGPQDPRVRP